MSDSYSDNDSRASSRSPVSSSEDEYTEDYSNSPSPARQNDATATTSRSRASDDHSSRSSAAASSRSHSAATSRSSASPPPPSSSEPSPPRQQPKKATATKKQKADQQPEANTTTSAAGQKKKKQKAQHRSKPHPQHPFVELILSMNQEGQSLVQNGDLKKASSAFRTAYELLENYPVIADGEDDNVKKKGADGDGGPAEVADDPMPELTRDSLLAITYNNLGCLERRRDNNAAATVFLEACQRLEVKTQGAASPITLLNLASVAEDPAVVEAHAESALKSLKKSRSAGGGSEDRAGQQRHLAITVAARVQIAKAQLLAFINGPPAPIPIEELQPVPKTPKQRGSGKRYRRRRRRSQVANGDADDTSSAAGGGGGGGESDSDVSTVDTAAPEREELRKDQEVVTDRIVASFQKALSAAADDKQLPFVRAEFHEAREKLKPYVQRYDGSVPVVPRDGGNQSRLPSGQAIPSKLPKRGGGGQYFGKSEAAIAPAIQKSKATKAKDTSRPIPTLYPPPFSPNAQPPETSQGYSNNQQPHPPTRGADRPPEEMYRPQLLRLPAVYGTPRQTMAGSVAKHLGMVEATDGSMQLPPGSRRGGKGASTARNRRTAPPGFDRPMSPGRVIRSVTARNRDPKASGSQSSSAPAAPSSSSSKKRQPQGKTNGTSSSKGQQHKRKSESAGGGQNEDSDDEVYQSKNGGAGMMDYYTKSLLQGNKLQSTGTGALQQKASAAGAA